jgi:hypothetical protein
MYAAFAAVNQRFAVGHVHNSMNEIAVEGIRYGEQTAK